VHIGDPAAHLPELRGAEEPPTPSFRRGRCVDLREVPTLSGLRPKVSKLDGGPEAGKRGGDEVADRDARVAVALPGGPEVRLVVPAGWGPRRRTLLRQAAHRAGLGRPTLVEAPVAAVQHVVAGGTTLVVGSCVVVCDFGGGFEATVVRRGPAGFEVLSTIDGPDAGGARIDEVVAEELARVGDRPADAGAVPPVSVADRLVLLASARTAKEALTRSATVTVALPPPRPAVVLHSAVLEGLSGPVLVRAARTTRSPSPRRDHPTHTPPGQAAPAETVNPTPGHRHNPPEQPPTCPAHPCLRAHPEHPLPRPPPRNPTHGQPGHAPGQDPMPAHAETTSPN
jgi:hypothetical protein